MIDRAKASPFEEFAEFVNARHRLERRSVTGIRNDAGILIFDLAATILYLLQHHPDGLQDIERLEAGHDHGFPVELCDEFVGGRADHHRDMAGSKEAVEL